MVVWQDAVLAIGGVFGLGNKAIALYKKETTWPRYPSLFNAILYIGTVAAFASYGLWLTTLTSFCSMCIWFGIAIWRSPE